MASAAVLSVATFACVDLFHATDFATLCDVNPGAPACAAQDAAREDGSVDVLDAGQDADAGLCTQDKKLAQQRAIRACELEVSCGGAAESRPDCVAIAMQAYDCDFHPGAALSSYWACMRDVTTCSAYARCVFPGGVPTCNADGILCADSVVSSCAVGAGARGVSCAAEGKTCAQPGGVPQCTGLGGVACTGAPRCEGTATVVCDGAQVDQGQDCAALGMQCVSGAAPTCQSKLASACNGSATTCSAGRAESCLGGKKTSVDCSRLDVQCTPKEDVFQACTGRGPCTPACSGNQLTTCVRNNALSVSCSDLGLGPCAADAGARATCTPRK